MFCWAINLDKKKIDMEFFQFKKYSSFTFLDPQRTIFGFTLKAREQEVETQIPLSLLDNRLKIDLNLKSPNLDFGTPKSSKDSKLRSQLTERKNSSSKKYEFLRPSTASSSK